MRLNNFIMAGALCLLVPSLARASTVKYSYAQIYSANTTVDLVPSTSGSGGYLNGVKCVFPSNDSGAAVKVTVTLDGGTATSFTIDPTYFERESNGAGQYLSGWIPYAVFFTSSIHITLNNTSLGTATINCWASWTLG